MSNWKEYLQKKALLERGEGSIEWGASTHDNVTAKQAIEWVYSVLTVLDAKASALMRLNGVLIAAAAFMLAQYKSPSTLMANASWHPILVAIAALLSAISITCCLYVVSVSWNFLGKVKVGDLNSYSSEVEALVLTMIWRQRVYRFAWLFSLVAAGLFLTELGVQTVHIIQTRA